MDVVPGQPCSVRIDLRSGRDPALPDAESFRYTIRGEGSVPIFGQVDKPVSTTSAQLSVDVPVPSSVNISSLRVGARSVRAAWTSGGRPCEAVVHYRLVQPLPTWLSPADVRNLLGAARDEVGDDEVDLLRAYLEVEETLGAAALTAALAAGDRRTFLANDAVACTAALLLLPALQVRLAQQRSDGAISFSRFSKVDLDALRSSLTARYATAAGVVAAVAVEDVTSGGFMILTSPTDPVTGA